MLGTVEGEFFERGANFGADAPADAGVDFVKDGDGWRFGCFVLADVSFAHGGSHFHGEHQSRFLAAAGYGTHRT